MQIEINEDHIHHMRWAAEHRPDDPRLDAVIAAFQDAGVEIEVDIHLNHLPPRHDWAIIEVKRDTPQITKLGIEGGTSRRRYAMTRAMRLYYSYLRIEQGHRTKPAVVTLDTDTMTADIREKRYVSHGRFSGGHWE